MAAWERLCEHPSHDQYLEPARPGHPPLGAQQSIWVFPSRQLMLQQLLRCHRPPRGSLCQSLMAKQWETSTQLGGALVLAGVLPPAQEQR